ncbi:purine-nucleoside phosphorylase [Streptococcus sp. H49]|uniref:purine-nucleoside phosphorylase n=1 Tax=Streptococcus huangxiaojuni TaxID=3237239 RepID=UPI0034A47164
MSIHIAAKSGEIADKILLPGDPLRAKFIAENFLEKAACFNTVRGMLGYTGFYKGQAVSVMGTGMGMPSISIYVNELIRDYGVKKLIRVGTAGSIDPNVHVRELVLAQAAATNSRIISNDWPEYDFPQIADFTLLDKAYHIAENLGLVSHVGTVLSSDVFYSSMPERNMQLGEYGVKAIEMEAAALYYLAARYHVQALAVMTISDSLVHPEEDTTAEERETTFTDMMTVGLETLLADSED